MAISFVNVIIRNERRVQLIFSNALGGGASNTSLYKVSAFNGGAGTPSVVAIIGSFASNALEIQLSLDLVPGVAYEFQANGVPAIDASVTPTPSSVLGTMGEQPINTQTAVEGAVPLDLLLFGRDLLWQGSDFAENGGDMATVYGRANVYQALTRRALSEGLPWNKNYGAHPRSYVDGTPGAVVSLQGRAVSQFLLDDRVAQATAELQFDSTDPSNVSLVVSPVLIGAREASKVDPITIATFS